ncbi:hypothetical protein BFJ63_vAg19546 [Fusarium oxysporum f. sp. narcissi]|uniref:Uncharacterized protein n=2 Tax=Fusarium TaxID=5506 RepID=A0A4Q2UUE9_FUSOX|nr:hypothetical protein BFJ72_g14556 [Fusarium proliferatum]RYC77582.1 hypothetical protein BFJ63_vAg19546 [Fusarium oxysporum f. sp. narcissi]
MPVDTPQVSRFGLRGLAGALLGLTAQRVKEADLHIQRDALQLHRVQVVDQRGRRRRAVEQRFPQRHAHRGTVVVAPAQEGRACASGLLGQLHVEQREGIGPRLLQHAPMRQADQAVAQRRALVGPGLQTSLTFKRL